MLATRWINPLVRRNTKALTKRSYATASFDYSALFTDLGDLYLRWVWGHIAVGSLVGSVMAPLMHSQYEYNQAKQANRPINKGDVFIESVLMAPVGIGIGALSGCAFGASGPIGYVVAGGYWWLHRDEK